MTKTSTEETKHHFWCDYKSTQSITYVRSYCSAQPAMLWGCILSTMLPMWVAAASSLLESSTFDPACRFADCASYCSGSCPFRPNISFAGNENLTLYRMTPYNISNLEEHNTGDIQGDLGFLLKKYLEESKCKPPFITEQCFLDDHTIVAQFQVEFDGACVITSLRIFHCRPYRLLCGGGGGLTEGSHPLSLSRSLPSTLSPCMMYPTPPPHHPTCG